MSWRYAAKPLGGWINSIEDADELIARVIGRDDPFEHAEILSDINGDLNHDNLGDRMADAGFGPATRATAATVLDRLKTTIHKIREIPCTQLNQTTR